MIIYSKVCFKIMRWNVWIRIIISKVCFRIMRSKLYIRIMIRRCLLGL